MAPADIPAAPAEYGDAQIFLWQRLCELMSRRGLSFDGQDDVMRRYVAARGEAEEAQRHVDLHGAVVSDVRTGNPIPNPYRKVAREAEASLLRLRAELGLARRGR